MNIDAKIVFKSQQIEFSKIQKGQVWFVSGTQTGLTFKNHQGNLPPYRSKQKGHLTISVDTENMFEKVGIHSLQEFLTEEEQNSTQPV